MNFLEMNFLNLETLQIIWYAVFIISIFAYTVLDGFDIGVGCLQLFAKTDTDRRIFLNAIGPVWDGNSLWVVITGGVLFAGFPQAFGVLFSALYIPVTLLIFAYIFRATAIEFRSRVESTTWRTMWDCIFSGSSYLLAIGWGVVVAHLVTGLPIDENGLFQGRIIDLISPYSVTVGFFATILLMVHGGLYLNMKTTGALQERVQVIVKHLLTILIVSWAILTHVTLVFAPHVADIIRSRPIFFINEIIAIIGLTAMVTAFRYNCEGRAFLSSFIFIGSQIANLTYALFPYIIRSTISPEASLTLYNSSASVLTMHVLFIIALLGIPLFLFYAIYTYRVFKGKVELDAMSY